jgi:hypothetical protein
MTVSRSRLAAVSVSCVAVLGLAACAGKFTGGGHFEGYIEDSRAHFNLNAEAIDCKDDGDLFVDQIRGYARYTDREADVQFRCEFEAVADGGDVPAWVFHNFRTAVFIGEVSSVKGENDVDIFDSCVFRVSDFSEPGNGVTPDEVSVAVCDGEANGVVEAFFGNPCDGAIDYGNAGELHGGNVQYHLSHAPRSENQCTPVDYGALTAQIEALFEE